MPCCKLCGNEVTDHFYCGPIRNGRFGEQTGDDITIWKCRDCGAGFLDQGREIDYSSAEYRTLVDGDAAPQSYYTLHDPEQAEKLRIVGTDRLRDKVIMDIGCGAGSFLDLVSGYALKTLAVEPMLGFHPILLEHGHQVYAYADDAARELAGTVDLAVCFSVIEHIADPVALLQSVRQLLKPGGRLVLSTPNVDDWMLELLPAEYGSFFFRTVHQWYFNGESLRRLAALCKFGSCSIHHVHRFDLSNLLVWMRDKRPSGRKAIPVWPELDAAFRSRLEAAGRSDYMYAEMYLA